jgi:hypothetical protein
MHRLAISMAVLAFFLNPGLACTSGSEEPEFQYGEAEMKSAVEGTWVLVVSRSSTSPTEEITLQLAESSKAQPDKMQVMRNGRAGLVRSAAACGTRTFVTSAHACADLSEMPLDVALVNGPADYKDAVMSGRLMVGSLIFTQGDFSLSLGALSVHAAVGPDGTVSTVSAYEGSSAVSVVSLTRTAK